MKLTTDQLDILTELINIGVGQAAAMLNEMIEFPIRLQVPKLQLLTWTELQKELGERLGIDLLSSVQLEFDGSFAGTAQLVFPTESAATLVSVLTGEDEESPELNALKIGTLTEVGNIVINGVMGVISNMLEQPMRYAVPTYTEEDIKHLVPQQKSEPDIPILLAQTRFNIEALQVQGDIILFFNVGSFDTLLNIIDNLD